MSSFFDDMLAGTAIEGAPYTVTRESIRAFADATLDFNPLHLDDNYMRTHNFGKTNFGGVIMHGLTGYGLITRMLTDWAYSQAGMLRRMEARWIIPVKPGDVIQARGTVSAKRVTHLSRWTVLDVGIVNQRGEQVSSGEAHVEFPLGAAA